MWGGGREEFAEDPEKRELKDRRYLSGWVPHRPKKRAFPEKVRRPAGQRVKSSTIKPEECLYVISV